MKKLLLLILATSILGCASQKPEKNYQVEMLKLIKSDFKSEGSVNIKKFMAQDEVQKFCSSLEEQDATIDELATIRESQLRTVKYPKDGKYLGDWKAGNEIANNGKGGQFSDEPGSVSGGNCYGCHQITKEEVAYGTIGPSLYQYGKLRGNTEDIYKYTWAKIYNAQSFIACSSMPRFGHQGILTEQQIKDVMALLLAPESPVNQ
ncbi:MAG: sulfur oxidation c-type cytochrome SoxX [Methylotenera sp.]